MGRKKIHDNRSKAHVDAVKAKGGSRRTFLLSPEATKGLARWRERIEAKSDRDAIEQAILAALLHVRGEVIMQTQVLEADGGNIYRPHRMMVSSGQFWRCKHGSTGFAAGMEWVGCIDCQKTDPEAFAQWNEAESKKGQK